MNAVAAALRELASLNETEPSVRAALEAWPEVVFSGAVAGAVRDVARRIRLGATTHDALAPLCELGPDGTTLRRVIAGHAHHGGSLATSLRSLADVIEDRDRLAHEGQVAGAAARLSGRLLALIGGGSILVVIVSEPALDGSTVVSAGAAAALVAAGVAWTRRLLPRVPRGDDPVAAQVDLLAGLVSGGRSRDLRFRDPSGLSRPTCANDAAGRPRSRLAAPRCCWSCRWRCVSCRPSVS